MAAARVRTVRRTPARSAGRGSRAGGSNNRPTPGGYRDKAVRVGGGGGAKGRNPSKRPTKKKKPTRPTPAPGGFALTPAYSETGHPRMQIVAEGGIAFQVPYAPRATQLGGFAPQFDTVARGGLRPLLLRSGDSLVTLEYDLVLGYPDPQQSVEVEAAALRALAASGARMMVALDPATAGRRWRITEYSEEIAARQHGTNEPTRAVVSMKLTEASDPVVAVGPVSGGHSSGPKGKGDDKKRPRTYTVKKGDTLRSISKRFYGDASYWDDIARANKIRDPKKGLKVGSEVRLPKVAVDKFEVVKLR